MTKLINNSGEYFDTDTLEIEKASLADILDRARECFNYLNRSSEFVNWNMTRFEDLEIEDVETVAYYATNLVNMLSLIENGNYKEVNNYGNL